jgi:nucleotide-binding universal stress UspA family protein
MPSSERSEGHYWDFHEAINDFMEAREQAAMQAVVARLTGRSNELLSYEEVAEKLKLSQSTELGRRDIPLNAIVGSVGRYTDFTRTFLPRHDFDRNRWANVKAAMASGKGVPPIDVYKVGEVYFVRDGNHRVSVARQDGATTIEANIIEVHTPVPLTPDVQADDLILKAEYAEFLEQTGFHLVCADVDLSLTAPGQYSRLKEHIDVHRYFMGQDQKREIPYDEAIRDWHQEVYLPLVLAIREQGLLRWFPGRTEADLYLWVSEQRAALEEELGWKIRPEAAVTDVAAKESPAERQAVGDWRKTKIADRYTDRLFLDILVPLNGETDSWQALDQALFVARREQAQVHGLHIVAADGLRESPEAQAIQATFKKYCDRAGVTGSLAIETGEIARKICERAVLTDMVVLNVAHPPAGGLASLGSGLRTIIWRCARPVLTVPGWSTKLSRALLAYDGSSKSREALFVATYLAERWQTALTVVSATDGSRPSAEAMQYVHTYLDWHEVQAEFVQAEGAPGETVLKTAQERAIDLIMMGGYGATPMKEVILGSTVNRVLRETSCPVFICR